MILLKKGQLKYTRFSWLNMQTTDMVLGVQLFQVTLKVLSYKCTNQHMVPKISVISLGEPLCKILHH